MRRSRARDTMGHFEQSKLAGTGEPRISIVVATYNAGGTLERCLRSLESQTVDDWELLVPDGQSTDNTLAILERHSSLLAWSESAPDNGIYDAWNKALPHAKGEYVCFLGADDAWADADALARLLAAIGDGHYDLVTSRGNVVAENGSDYEFGSAMDFRRLGRRMMVCHPGLLHRRELFADHGRFDASLKIVGDLEFLLRLPLTSRTLHVDSLSVRVDGSGISREQVGRRLREQRDVLVRSPRYGVLRGYLAWFDKLWRWPIARLLNLPF